MLFETFAPLNTLLQSAGRLGFLPSADIAVSDNDMVLTMDVPGLTAEDLSLEVIQRRAHRAR